MNPGRSSRSTPTPYSHTGSRARRPDRPAPDQSPESARDVYLNGPVPHGPGLTRPLQTHLVLDGRLKHSGYQDEATTGPVIRALADGRTLARLMRSGHWSRPVREARERPKRGTDLIRPLGPAVVVQLTHGEFY